MSVADSLPCWMGSIERMEASKHSEAGLPGVRVPVRTRPVTVARQAWQRVLSNLMIDLATSHNLAAVNYRKSDSTHVTSMDIGKSGRQATCLLSAKAGCPH